MPYELVWTEHALDSAAGYLADDPTGLTQLLAALDRLPDEPRPESSTAYGSNDLRRLHIGRYRALYEITGGNAAISSGSRRQARAWSRAIYRSYDVDGIYYQTSSTPTHRSIALFERARAAVPPHPDLNAPLTHPGLRAALERIADVYDMYLVTAGRLTRSCARRARARPAAPE